MSMVIDTLLERCRSTGVAEADRDLQEIWEFTSRDSFDHADVVEIPSRVPLKDQVSIQGDARNLLKKP